jgi:NhaP-type Na+/H+ or K+/H+ antiporter
MTENSPHNLMDLTFFFALLGGLLVLAFVTNRLVRFTRVPDVILLMATGVLIGPVLHWVNPDIFRGATHGFGSLALILILFEGGLDLKLREILKHFGSGFFLSLFSYVLGFLLQSFFDHFPVSEFFNSSLISTIDTAGGGWYKTLTL